MNTQRFKPGQEVTPKYSRPWTNIFGEVCSYAPKFGEIYRVDFYDHKLLGQWFLALEGVQGFYYEGCFEPVVSSKTVEKDLKEEQSTVEV